MQVVAHSLCVTAFLRLVIATTSPLRPHSSLRPSPFPWVNSLNFSVPFEVMAIHSVVDEACPWFDSPGSEINTTFVLLIP